MIELILLRIMKGNKVSNNLFDIRVEIRPVVKWAGGKRQIIDELLKRVPRGYNRYFEPFVGGGALLFKLLPEDAVINDYNKELMNMYEVIRDNVDALIKDLKKHRNTKEYYYKIRNIDREPQLYKKMSPVERASRFIYLNRTCYNGLYRVNSRGEFNVPFGNYKNPVWLDEENLKLMSHYLQRISILNGDFEIIKGLVSEGDFVYFDPPYVPLSETASFTSYTNKGFTLEDQKRLKLLCDYLDSIGAKFMLSNSYTEFTLRLYKRYHVEIVRARRAINSNGKKRGEINEIIVRNYS